MQTITIYIDAHDTLGNVRDYANARDANVPSLTRDVEVLLKLRLFKEEEVETPYPMEQLQQVAAWQFVMDTDYNKQTTPPIIADNANIELSTVTETIGDTEHTYTQVAVPIPGMNSEELIQLLGSSEDVGGLIGELVGYDGNADKIFICQIKGFSVRNLVYGTGEPTQTEPTYLNASEVRALIAAGAVCQFSEDGTNWHGTQTTNDIYIRWRSASDSNAEWTVAIRMPAGPAGDPGEDGDDGDDGQSAYVYVRYASDDQGTDFSDAPAITRKYIAIKTTTEPIAEPAASDFTGLWMKFLGDDGTGTGDMTKAVYDTDNDGKVNLAAKADKATKLETARKIGQADFDGSADISLNDIGAAAKNHTHKAEDLQDSAIEKAYTGSIGILYLNKRITRTTSGASGTLAIDITSIKDAEGNAATIQEDKCYTWELHVRATGAISSITVGSASSTMSAISIPETLALVNGNTTYHVFTIRGFYKSGAVNNIDLHVNYAYSYEA